MDITIDKEQAVDELTRILVKASNATTPEMRKAIEDSFDRLLKSSIENEFRLLSKNKADEEAIHVFTENLRQLLLASPLGSKKVLALDPGFRTGCKLVCLMRREILFIIQLSIPILRRMIKVKRLLN
jgi:uncharacterized protein